MISMVINAQNSPFGRSLTEHLGFKIAARNGGTVRSCRPTGLTFCDGVLPSARRQGQGVTRL